MSEQRAPRSLALLLAALSALGPFSIDTYLPSFPDMALRLAASPLEVQQTLTAYLAPFAIMTLWHGAFADALGRRRVVLVALVAFALASLGCAFATRIEHLWLLRAVQGISAGAGIVISRAIVRDLYDGAPAQRLMAQITMMFAIAPALAPLIGGWLQRLWGWRSVFLFLALMGLLLLIAIARLLPETLPPERRQPLRPAYLLGAYRRVLGHPPFLLATGALASNFAGFFVYVLSAPMFLMHHLGLPETAFLWLFGPAMLGLMGGSWLAGQLSARWPAERTLLFGYRIMALAALANLIFCAFFPAGLPQSVAPLLAYTFGMSLAMPVLTLRALDPFPSQRGLAASCQTFLQAGGNALVAALIAPLLWDSLLSLSLGMVALLLLGGGFSLSHRRLTAP